MNNCLSYIVLCRSTITTGATQLNKKTDWSDLLISHINQKFPKFNETCQFLLGHKKKIRTNKLRIKMCVMKYM